MLPWLLLGAGNQHRPAAVTGLLLHHSSNGTDSITLLHVFKRDELPLNWQVLCLVWKTHCCSFLHVRPEFDVTLFKSCFVAGVWC